MGRVEQVVGTFNKWHVCFQVTVIEEAIKYIDELHDALADRLNLQQSECHFRVFFARVAGR